MYGFNELICEVEVRTFRNLVEHDRCFLCGILRGDVLGASRHCEEYGQLPVSLDETTPCAFIAGNGVGHECTSSSPVFNALAMTLFEEVPHLCPHASMIRESPNVATQSEE